MAMQYDTIVIGAGPAGTTAARQIADTGLSVLLLEKETMPRVKPCGGALTHRALDLLPPGAKSQLLEDPRQWTFQGAEQPAVTLTRETPYCHIVERQYFDQFLAQAAERAGAHVHDTETVTNITLSNNRVEVTTNRSRYESAYLVAADGAHGPTARFAGIPRPRHGAAIEAEIEATPTLWNRYAGRVEIHIGQYPWGYAWVIPRHGKLNLGVGSFRPNKFPLKQQFYAFVEQITGHRNVTPLAHPLPYRLRYVRPVKGRLLLTGDAAGYMDAFSAEGIYSALRSGELAATTVVDAVIQGATLDSYSDHLYQEFWPSLKSAIKLGLLFYPLPKFWSAFFVKNQSLLSDYLDVAMGVLPYRVLQKHTERAFIANHQFLPFHSQYRP